MGTQSIRVLAAWLCLATCLFTGGAPAQGLILCFGLDGHVEVSGLQEGCVGCPGEAEGPAGSDETGLASGSSCCPCVDVPMTSAGDAARPELPRPSLALSDVLPATLPALVPRFEGPGRSLRAGPPAPARSFALGQLRSVRILI